MSFSTTATTGCLAAASVLGAVTTGVVVRPSAVDDCPPGSSWNGVFCAPDEHDPGGELTTDCHQADPLVRNVPCRIGDYRFVASPYDCYLGDISLDVPAHDPRWEGHAPGDGAVYRCIKLTAVGDGGQPAWGGYRDFWAALPPGEQPPVVVVDPEAVARQLLDGMTFEAPELGLAPRPLEEAPGSIGLVGAPVWMWVANAGPATWGPREEAVTVGGVTVEVVAEVESVTWDMGDGGRVRCGSAGTAYAARLGVRASPSCGHVYTETSGDQPGAAYTVTATANWTATWAASTGAEGTLDGPRPAATAHVRIGERQVIETG